MFLRTRAANGTAASAGGTHIVRAKLHAVVVAIKIIHRCKKRMAPILSDGRILVGLLCRTDGRNGILGRAEKVVQGFKVVAKRPPIETGNGDIVVLFAPQIVKRFENLAHELVPVELQGAMEGSRLTIFLQSTGSSVSAGGQDGAEKESEEGDGKELHGR